MHNVNLNFTNHFKSKFSNIEKRFLKTNENILSQLFSLYIILTFGNNLFTSESFEKQYKCLLCGCVCCFIKENNNILQKQHFNKPQTSNIEPFQKYNTQILELLTDKNSEIKSMYLFILELNQIRLLYDR